MSSEVNPLISVIVPVYNVEKYLARCLDSILNQSFRDIEVICVNDCSPDDSLHILHQYQQKDSRLVIIDLKKNKGLSGARNAGLEKARGCFVSFVDSDDCIRPGMFENIAQHLSKEIDILFFGADEILLQGSKEVTSDTNYFDIPHEGFKVLSDEDILKASVTVWNKVFRLEKIRESNLQFPEGCSFEDNAFYFNFAFMHRNAFFIKDKYYMYFRRCEGITSSLRHGKEKLSFHFLKILENIHIFWSDHSLLEEHADSFEKLCIRMFRSAIEHCPEFELPGIVYEMSCLLRKWNIPMRSSILNDLKDGNTRILLTGKTKMDIRCLKQLKGFQKIFYIGKSGQYRVLRVFTKPIAVWRH